RLARAPAPPETPPCARGTPADGRAVKTALSVPFPVDFGDVEVVRDEAVSKHGTRVPIHVLHRKGLRRDGSNPALLVGYGGFNVTRRSTAAMLRRRLTTRCRN